MTDDSMIYQWSPMRYLAATDEEPGDMGESGGVNKPNPFSKRATYEIENDIELNVEWSQEIE